MAMYIFTHNPGSQGGKALADALGIRRVKHEGSKVRLGPNDTLINWGSQRLPAQVTGAGRIYNNPERLANVGNKLRFFERFGNQCRVVPWTADVGVVRQWLAEGSKVVCRHVLNGHSGAGIEIIEGRGVDIPRVPLYTKYVPKHSEWRIHVLGGQVIDSTRKIRDPDFRGEPNWQVRNHDGGFIYARNSGTPSEDVVRQAVAAIEAAGLDFGAVDVMCATDREHTAYVLEINSAPGIVGTSVERYAQGFRNATR